MASSGALPTQLIRQLARVGHFQDENGSIAEKRLQPASADLTLSPWGYCVKATFLPNPNETVEQAIKRYALFPINITEPQILNLGSTYIFRLNEIVNLTSDLFAYFSPKSSVGRLNVWVRTLADRVSRFDRIPAGYSGPLYVMVTPKSWPVLIQAGLSLNQIRFFTNHQEILSRLELQLLHEELGLMNGPDGIRIDEPVILDDGILLTVDLTSDIVAYRAKNSIEILDLTQEAIHDPLDFFDPITTAKNDELILRENEFYLLPTYEAFRVPSDYCVEMVAYDVASGEFRSHYAGFFDPGFGYGDGTKQGTQATLEVIPHETVILRHRQPVCKMVFERIVTRPEKIYGLEGSGSHYQEQRGPGLSKYFRARTQNGNGPDKKMPEPTIPFTQMEETITLSLDTEPESPSETSEPRW